MNVDIVLQKFNEGQISPNAKGDITDYKHPQITND